MLDDGTYDGIVIDAEDDGASVRLDITILAGERKGEVVTMHATGLVGNPLDRLGMPVTITVAEGAPRVTFDQ